jgi:predicted kinase
MNTQCIVLLDGMMGAGKTTLSTAIAEHYKRTAVIGMDKVKRFISDFERCELDNTIAKDVVIAMTKTYLLNGISVVVEQPIKHVQEIATYESIAADYSVPLYKIQLFTTKDVALTRITKRQQASDLIVPPERIHRNIDVFTLQKDPDFLQLDTSTLTPQEVFTEVRTFIGLE